jgi:Nucleoside-diphosphate-sugar pyrophosphorylase involved in lipopolysaccharide biosynthesis/translation initiation factor 2B, gamma/epsilon subunits (eIF-2Bgamma/eIF-2Bepsilon)
VEISITRMFQNLLLKIKNRNLLDNTFEIIKSIGINKIKINTYYLGDQIKKYIEQKGNSSNIKIVSDGKKILDTGGGIYNLIQNEKEEDFITFNPDTLWNSKYIETINKMQNYYFNNSIKNLLMVVKKNKSFDDRLKGDFILNNNKLSKQSKNDFIFTGCQILNKKIFNNVDKKVFSMSEIWDNLIEKNELCGFESPNDFLHITDIEIFNKLS